MVILYSTFSGIVRHFVSTAVSRTRGFDPVHCTPGPNRLVPSPLCTLLISVTSPSETRRHLINMQKRAIGELRGLGTRLGPLYLFCALVQSSCIEICLSVCSLVCSSSSLLRIFCLYFFAITPKQVPLTSVVGPLGVLGWATDWPFQRSRAKVGLETGMRKCGLPSAISCQMILPKQNQIVLN
jgi:hypothetical protein